MARKTLFGFTRKRIFDSLLLRFTGFHVKQQTAPSEAITFHYFGNLRIEIGSNKDRDELYILTWRSDDKPGTSNLGNYRNRWQINDRITEIFAGFDAVNGKPQILNTRRPK